MRERDRQRLGLRLTARASTARWRVRAALRDAGGGGWSGATCAASTADCARASSRPTAGCAPPSTRAAARGASAARATLAARLDALSPLAVLGRGYAVCWNEARTSIIRSSGQVQPGDRVRVTLAEGELALPRRGHRNDRNDADPSRTSSRPSPNSRRSSSSSRTATSPSTSRSRCSSAASSCRATATTSWAPAQRRIELLTERGTLTDASHLVDLDDDRR